MLLQRAIRNGAALGLLGRPAICVAFETKPGYSDLAGVGLGRGDGRQLARSQVVAFNDELGGYYDLIKDKGYLFAGAPAYPFHAQVREATAPIFYQILLGDLAPQEGLDQMAAAAEATLSELGYRK